MVVYQNCTQNRGACHQDMVKRVGWMLLDASPVVAKNETAAAFMAYYPKPGFHSVLLPVRQAE
jgi:hypothetical protein